MISVWGEVEIINVKTAEEASNILSHLTYRRTKNMNGYELKVGYFKQNQTAAGLTQVRSSIHYADVFNKFDKTMLKTIARGMNFKVGQIYPTESYGYRLPNGTYVGALGTYVAIFRTIREYTSSCFCFRLF